ncbi:hypothetical protein BJ878DRAFT_554005 [Calycina marina]|uniref:Zn(2)-C6 fungal-type domain-containing protein n=1 Tax=Calycina marina TaxID=1763456 RepID=A0A9P7Z117_9HELO|nr:hypothetical protein BJ878DRAFT_554005 [Calycina marina]
MAQPLQYGPPVSHSGSLDSPAGQKGDQPQHKRVYQACIPCRRRKVKCDLGSVDNPSEPPCVRCRRESKECFFSATRRKRKTDDGQEGSLDGFDYNEDYVMRNGRKMGVHGSPGADMRQESMGAPPSARSAGQYVDNAPIIPPLTPGGSIGRAQPLRRPQQNDQYYQPDESSMQLENPEASQVMRKEVYGPHDALKLLYEAAANHGDNSGAREGSEQLSPIIGGISQNQRPTSSHLPSIAQRIHNSMQPPEITRQQTIDPILSDNDMSREGEQSPGYQNALKAWSRFRFVRAGWFTAAEAIEYINYYYKFLSPLTPVSPPTFLDPATHIILLTEEPILTVTLLTIATRYRKMPGPGGHCRSHAIHEQLWTCLRGMIERCLWGQEAFGGGFCGSGAQNDSTTAPWRGLRKGSLRTLGTIESLMILTEWHPRALHFPPAEATDELMSPSYDGSDTYSNVDETGNRPPSGIGGIGGRRIEGWLEPAWRSDRMCWMLLSTAMGLSYELGVFDDLDELLADGGEIVRPEYEEGGYQLRAGRIKRLILIYVQQLAGRLGWTNMVPENLRDTDPAFSPRKRKSSFDGKTPDTNNTMANSLNYIPDLELDDRVIHCWASISNAMRLGNEKLFRSRQYTTKIIQDGSYVELLKAFQPMLKHWLKEFERFNLPQYIRHILRIEYEYVRIYVNSLSLQAVVERCTTNAGNQANNAGQGENGELSPQTQNYFGKLPLAQLGGFSVADKEYVKEVVEGSRSLLRTVVEGLLPNDYLKHAPVRTYFRIISGAMFLLKTFALGASKSDVEISIGLMDQAVSALRNCVVDDVHLGIRFADLLETLTSRLRSRFISAPALPPADLHHKRTYSPVTTAQPGAKRTKHSPHSSIHEWQAGQQAYNMQSNPNTIGLDSVSATPFDLNHGAFYANSTYSTPTYGNDMQEPLFGNSDWAGGNEMWYLPPGSEFYNNVNNQTITQTAEGVNVGGMDLLDFLALNDPMLDGTPYSGA